MTAVDANYWEGIIKMRRPLNSPLSFFEEDPYVVAIGDPDTVREALSSHSGIITARAGQRWHQRRLPGETIEIYPTSCVRWIGG